MNRWIAAGSFACIALCAQTKKILYLNPSPADLKELQSVSAKVRVVPVTRATVMNEIADADAFIGEIRPEEVRAAKKLKWVQSYIAGVERFLQVPGSEALRDSNIILTNNRITQGPEMADHAFAMLLFLTRRLDLFLKDNPIGPRTEPYYPMELNGRTALVVGVGGIGTQIAIRAWASGMQVYGVDTEEKPYTPYIKRVVRPDGMNELIPLADVVFISAPHTAASYKMIGARQFELMKQDSYFIAVSRGALYDTNALVKALDSRRLAGAGLDVTDPEPLPAGHPLRKFNNVMITPHIAGHSDKSLERMFGTIKENVRRFANDEPLVNVVDKQKGY